MVPKPWPNSLHSLSSRADTLSSPLQSSVGSTAAASRAAAAPGDDGANANKPVLAHQMTRRLPTREGAGDGAFAVSMKSTRRSGGGRELRAIEAWICPASTQVPGPPFCTTKG
jgi:hypothetical protein